MKRFLSVLLLCAFVCCLLTAFSAEGGAEALSQKSLTLMVYMCGSDLESWFGSASADLAEMMESGFDSERINLLVMAGGSERWESGFPADQTSIAELNGSGLYTVWHSGEPLSMAESSTLTTFLDFGYEKYPAESYALIIWDHGGGPNEGVCFDELFSGSTLSLRNLRRGLQASGIGLAKQKLSWIGFDACLMASIEAAYYLQDCAEYMVASQEQEPSSGWDYAFLNRLDKEKDSVAACRRIIDTYFDSHREAKRAVTLSCTDLNGVGAIRRAMDEFFDGLYPVLSDESYSLLSQERHKAQGFGRAEYSDSADYDLVDLVALTKLYEGEGVSGEDLKNAVKRAVVYSRSNIEGANGLSVYHPCYNRDLYSERWSESYEADYSAMSRDYVTFIRRFGTILTGRQLGDWSALQTVRAEENGEIRFSVQLSDEQAKHFEHATLKIIKQIYSENVGLDRSFYAVWETPYLTLDGSNTLFAAWPRKAVYIADEEGNHLAGPIEYRITDDGKLQISAYYMDDNDILDEDMLNTLYYCSMDTETGSVSVDSIAVYDWLTQSYSRRMTVDEDYFSRTDYTHADFYIRNLIPDHKGDELPGFNDWPPNDNIVGYTLDLPCRWHFVISDDREARETAFASFQITDTQGITHSSSLSRVFPELVSRYEAEDSRCAIPDGELTVSAFAEQFHELDAVCVSLSVSGSPKEISRYTVDHVTVNQGVPMDPGWTGGFDNSSILLSFMDLSASGLSEIRSIDFELSMRSADRKADMTVPVHLDFPIPIMPTHEAT